MRPCRRATSTTRTPGCKLSATIRAFKSSGQRRFPRRGSTTSQRPINPSPPSAMPNPRLFPETFRQTRHASEIRIINRAETALAAGQRAAHVHKRERRQSLQRASFVPKRAEGSRLQITSQQRVTGAAGCPGISGRMKSEQVGASHWNSQPGPRRNRHPASKGQVRRQ